MHLDSIKMLENVHSSEQIVLDDELTRQLQAILLMMLDDIIAFCDSNDITYILSGGTTLGALRHQGFIPWDDDIDMDMPREDYDRFIQLFPQAYSDKYQLQAPEITPDIGTVIARVRLRNTTMRMLFDFCLPSEDCGIFIDIFPMENTFNNSALRFVHGFACQTVGFLYSCRRFWRDRKSFLAFGEGNAGYERGVRLKAAIGMPLALAPMKGWTALTSHVYSLCKNSQSEYVTVPSGRDHYFKSLGTRERLGKTREAQFEGRAVRIPADAEGYLEQHYGDWQRVPPPEEREHHAYLELDYGPYAALADKGEDRTSLPDSPCAKASQLPEEDQ